MEIKKIGIVGAGAMGGGIAQVCATAGYHVIIRDVSMEALDRAKTSIEKGLGKLVSKEKMTEAEKDTALSHIHWTKDLVGACQNVDLIIEAVFENLGLNRICLNNLKNYPPRRRF